MHFILGFDPVQFSVRIFRDHFSTGTIHAAPGGGGIDKNAQ